MLKYLRGKRYKSATRRTKLTKESFAFKKTVPHGFPYHPSCMAYDAKLSLFAIGTQKGVVRVYGRPGVELEASLEEESEIRQIKFVEGRGQLVVLCCDNSLTLWEINVQKKEDGSEKSFLEKVKTCNHFHKEQREGNLKQITTFTINSSNETLLVGTQGGNIYIMSLETFDLTDEIIYQDVVIQNIPEDSYKKNNPGEVEAIVEKPHDAGKFLIGYNRGLLVLWNNKTLTAEHFYIADQQLESVSWLTNGEEFISSHADGIYIRWKVTDNLKPSRNEEKEYGPYACKPIQKIIGLTTIDKEEYLIFGGGLPRYTFSDKYPVTLIKKGAETKHHVLDFSSKVIDFIVINADDKDEKAMFDYPEALLVLTEQEIVAIDLQSSDWLQYPLPYLSSIHSSDITFFQYYSDIPADVYKKIQDAGAKQNENKYSTREWPIKGGIITEKAFALTNDLLLTGHEDGSVRFWASGDVSVRHLFTLETSKLFADPEDDIIPIDSDEVPANESGKEVEEQWPPFRKVGTYDPFFDDVRLRVQSVVFSPYSSTLVVGGSAGQVVVFGMTDENTCTPLRVETMNIIGKNENFPWKGQSKLNPRSEYVKFIGFTPLALIQTNPPSGITALAWHPEWNLLSIGTGYGFGLYDFVQHTVVVTKSTLNTQDSAALSEGDALISRRKSFRKSLRESFRRLKRVKSQRETKKSGASPSSSPTPSSTPTKSSGGERAKQSQSPTKELETPGTKPIERRVEARTTDEITGPVVKYLYIGLAGIDKKDTGQAPTLWAGTQAGIVYAFAFNIPGMTPKEGEEDLRKTEKITFHCGREIRLAHKAPVVFIHLIDPTGYPLPDPLEVKHGKARAATAADKVLICTEEQFILFTLPQLKHHSKYKLTAGEGVKARKVALSQFTSTTDETLAEHCIVCLTNNGEIEVFTTELEQKMKTSCIDTQDKHGTSHLIFTPNAEGLYLHSFCEFRRFSLSPKRVVEAVCLIPVPESARPKKVVEVPSSKPEVAEEAKEEPVKKEEAETFKETKPEAKKEETNTEKEKSQEPIKEKVIEKTTAKLSDDKTSEKTEEKVEEKKESVVEKVEQLVKEAEETVKHAATEAVETITKKLEKVEIVSKVTGKFGKTEETVETKVTEKTVKTAEKVEEKVAEKVEEVKAAKEDKTTPSATTTTTTPSSKNKKKKNKKNKNRNNKEELSEKSPEPKEDNNVSQETPTSGIGEDDESDVTSGAGQDSLATDASEDLSQSKPLKITDEFNHHSINGDKHNDSPKKGDTSINTTIDSVRDIVMNTN